MPGEPRCFQPSHHAWQPSEMLAGLVQVLPPLHVSLWLGQVADGCPAWKCPVFFPGNKWLGHGPPPPCCSSLHTILTHPPHQATSISGSCLPIRHLSFPGQLSCVGGHSSPSPALCLLCSWWKGWGVPSLEVEPCFFVSCTRPEQAEPGPWLMAVPQEVSHTGARLG